MTEAEDDANKALVELLNSMQATFRPPNFDQQEGGQTIALQAYSRALKGFDAVTLRTAWANVVRSHVKPTWPVAGVIVAECRSVLKGPGKPVQKDSITQRRLAWERARTERLAFVACQEGVAWSYKAAILYDGKRPEEISIPRLKRQQMEARATRDRIQDDAPHSWNGHDIGVIEGAAKISALVMWERLEINERYASDEIRRHQS